jgi:hypothetical protein
MKPRRSLPVLLVATALATGCAASGGVSETSDTPRRDLAELPTSLAPTPAGTDTGTGSNLPASRSAGSDDGAPSGSTEPSAAPSAGTPDDGPTAGSTGGRTGGRPFRTFATMTDGRSDAGLGAPAYADLRLVTLADNGVDLRVTVVVDATLPAQVADDETMGIGVDLYPSRQQRESDYQLFVDGEPDGWFAYLDTPRGFVRYPGTFGIGGSRLVFTVPLSSVGSPEQGRLSAFVDWSRRSSGLTGNRSSNDYAPTLGTKTYSR